MKEKLELVKKFVVDHKEGIIMGVAGITGIGIMWTSSSLVQHDKFLKEKGLYEEFYNAE